MDGKLTFADLVQKSARLIQRMEPPEPTSRNSSSSAAYAAGCAIASLPELSVGIHEWFYGDIVEPNRLQSGSKLKPRQESGRKGENGRWWPPALTLMTWMAGTILRHCERKYLFWIGGAQFQPSIQLLGAVLPGHRLIERCIFIDPPNKSDRIWAIDQTLRSGAAGVVIADAAGADMAASRRWQLAAEAGGVCGLLARPPWEIHEQCLAITRWLVEPVPTITADPQWRVRLLRCKPPMPSAVAGIGWIAQWCYAASTGQGEMKVFLDASRESLISSLISPLV